MSAVEIQNIKMKTVTHVYALMCYPCLCPVPTPTLSPKERENCCQSVGESGMV
jgi:hypothetical protein